MEVVLVNVQVRIPQKDTPCLAQRCSILRIITFTISEARPHEQGGNGARVNIPIPLGLRQPGGCFGFIGGVSSNTTRMTCHCTDWHNGL